MVAQEAEATARNARAYYEAAVAKAHVSTVPDNFRECVKCATVWRADAGTDCPMCERFTATAMPTLPEGLIPLNMTKEDLVALASICSYWKNTNQFPSGDGQRIAASVIERSRGY